MAFVGNERGGRDIQVARFPAYMEEILAMDAGLYHALNTQEYQTRIAGAHTALAALERGLGWC